MSRAAPSTSPKILGAPRDGALLILCLLLTYAAEGVGAIASIHAAAFYASLAQPRWAPPPWLFGPVWTLLYTLMAVALWRVVRSAQAHATATAVFLVQLVINALWSWLFFRWHLGAVSFGWIVLLLAMIAATLGAFWRISRIAAILLLPYLGWVLFATLLSWTLWRANPAALG
jgi:tryptophan-rich sensory protein